MIEVFAATSGRRPLLMLGVRGKLFGVSLLLLLAVGLPSGLYLDNRLHRWLIERVESELLRQASVGRNLLQLMAPATAVDFDSVADGFAAGLDVRISIVSSEGVVLGDSELRPAELGTLENHRQRPEIAAALRQDHGTATRHSTTLQTDMLYVAVPFQLPGQQGVVRIAKRLSDVEVTIHRLRQLLLIAALIGLIAAVFISGLASQWFTHPIRRLAKRAGLLAEGNNARIPVASGDEIGRLAGSFNKVVDQLDQAVATLASERDQLETILEGMSDGILAVDSDQRISRFNRAAAELLQIDSSATGKALLETVPVPELAALARRDMGEKATETAELSLATGRRVVAQSAPLHTLHGSVVVLHDVSDMRRLEAVRRDFVANVSHELRTPVSVVRANSETLLNGALSDPRQAREFVEAIHRNANRLGHLVNDLLDLARIEAGEYELRPRPTNVRAAVDRTIKNLSASPKVKNQRIANQVPEDCVASVDTRALEQVLLNLVDNAVKYTPEGGSICISAQAQSDFHRIEISDDGPGITDKHRPRVFQRFYRVDPGRSRDVGGTGLGLAIVKHLITSMGGETGVEPVQPHGCRFWITLPLATGRPHH